MAVDIVPMTMDHVEGFWRTLDSVARERKFIGFLQAPPLESTHAFVSAIVAAGDVQMIAVADGEVVGWCDVLPKPQPIYAHNGTLGMGLRSEFRGMGLGGRLLEAALTAARGKGLMRVELRVFVENTPAIRLYEKYGFEREGVLRCDAEIDGVYKDSALMARLDPGLSNK